MEVKSVETFSVILIKLATPPLPTQTPKNESFRWPHHFWKVGGVLGRRDEPEAVQEIVPYLTFFIQRQLIIVTCRL